MSRKGESDEEIKARQDDQNQEKAQPRTLVVTENQLIIAKLDAIFALLQKKD